MVCISVSNIDYVKYIESTQSYHYRINNQIELYVCKERVFHLTLLNQLKPPYTIKIEDEPFLDNKIGSYVDFSFILSSVATQSNQNKEPFVLSATPL